MKVSRIWVIGFLAFGRLANAQTNFSIQSIQLNTIGQAVLSWPAVPNVTYNVQVAFAPGGPWYDEPGGQLTAYGTSLSYTDFNLFFPPFSPPPQGFYRLRKDCSRIVTLVLDRSASLNAPGVPAALEAGVTSFLSGFSESNDSVGLVSFASTATVDVPTGSPFKARIATAVNNLNFGGSTFMQGGLSNALVQEQSVVVPPGENPSMAIVLVTDGAPNTIQDTFNCGTPTLWNYGGVDGDGPVEFLNPTNGNLICTTSGGVPPCCPETTTFPSINGTSESFTAANVDAEAAARSIQFANGMRAQGIAVYAVGLGVGVDQTFFQGFVNDPTSPTYNSNQLVGKVAYAATITNLPAAFQQIAQQILGNCSP